MWFVCGSGRPSLRNYSIVQLPGEASIYYDMRVINLLFFCFSFAVKLDVRTAAQLENVSSPLGELAPRQWW